MKTDDPFREPPAWLIVVTWLFLAAWAAGVLGLIGCAPRVVLRQTSTVYVDEAEQVRVSLDAAWRATVRLDVATVDGGGNGSGVLVWTGGAVADVLTADHVVAAGGAQLVSIRGETQDGKRLLGRVVRRDWFHDLALVELLGHVETEPARLAPAPPRRLERVWQMGAPDGEMGHVGAGRWGALHAGNGPRRPLLRWVTGGFVVDGMSGGPVVDERGRLVGVNDLVHLMDAVDASDDDPEVRVPEMASAVDWRDVRDFLDKCGVPR